MKHIIGAFGIVMVLMLNLFICITVSNASAAAAEAKEFKADVVAEIENSNFNAKVIEHCISQAKKAGYQLEVINCMYDERSDIQAAEVVLTYQYALPLFGIAEKKTTRGIAR